MINFLIVILATLLVTLVPGYLLISVLVRGLDVPSKISLGFLLSAIMNTVVLFLLGVVQVDGKGMISRNSFFLLILIEIGILIIFSMRKLPRSRLPEPVDLVQLLIQSLVAGIILLSFAFKTALGFSLPVWIFLAGFSLVSLWNLVSVKSDMKLVCLLIFALGSNMIILGSMPAVHQMAKDVNFESQVAELIIEQGRLDAKSGTGFAQDYYGYTPVLHYMIAAIALVTGLSPFFVSKYILFILFKVASVFILYTFFSVFMSKPRSFTPALATFICLMTSEWLELGISRRTISLFFLMMAIYAAMKEMDDKDVIWSYLYHIFAVFIVISNHSISIGFLGILIGAYIFREILVRLLPEQKKAIAGSSFLHLGQKVLVFAAIFLVWEAATGVLLTTDILYAKGFLENIGSFFSRLADLEQSAVSSSVHISRPFERYLIILSQGLFVLASFAGFAVYASKSWKKDLNYFIAYLALASFAYYAFTAVFLTSSLAVMVQLFLPFFSLIPSLFIVYGYHFIEQRVRNLLPLLTLAGLSLIFFIGGIFLGLGTGINREAGEVLPLESASTYTVELVEAGRWLDANARTRRLFGDTTVFDIYSSRFRFDVTTDFWVSQFYLANSSDLGWMLQKEDIDFGIYRHTKDQAGISYFAINSHTKIYPSFSYGEPLPDEKLDKFSGSDDLDLIYTNGQMMIYYNRNFPV